MNKEFWQRKISRRQFCKYVVQAGIGISVSPLLVEILKRTAFAKPVSGQKGFLNKKEAMFYEKIDETTIQCHLCPRNCTLPNKVRGFCRAREPENGKHYSLVYSNPTAVHVDPIEKKPLFHFLPATQAFSVATAGCNFRCKFCQNWEISQFSPEETVNYFLPPKKLVEAAISYNCTTIAYTYTEPSIFYEYMLDTAKIAYKKGVKNIYHSNGSLNPEPLKLLTKYLDGANVDLKGFDKKFYKKICAGYLDTVLETLKILKENNVHLEITNLIIPTLNDNSKIIKEMCKWIKINLGDDIPIHFSRFYPHYKLKNLPPTPVKTLEDARKTALDVGLKFVYIGNVPGHKAENTYCPKCKKVLIRRIGYRILENNIVNGRCKFCKEKIPGVWQIKSPLRKTSLPYSKYLG